MQQQEKRRHRSSQIQKELHHVCPNHRAHPTLKRIKHRQHRDHQNRNAISCAKRHAHNFPDRRYPHALRQRTSPHENHRRHRPHPRSKTLFQKLVGGIEFTLEVLWYKYHAEDYSRHEVAQYQLQKTQVSAKGNRRRPDDRESGSLCRDDRARQRPPRRRAAAQKIVAQILLATPESQRQKA